MRIADLGAFCYMTKPFEHARLRDAVVRGIDAFEHQKYREKELQERLQSVHDSFFSLLCHEFNTPMNIVLGFADLLASSMTDPEQIAWVEEIRRSGRNLHEILMEIVDYTAASHLAASKNHSFFHPPLHLRTLEPVFQQKEISTRWHSDIPSTQLVLGPPDSLLVLVRKMVAMASRLDSLPPVDIHLTLTPSQPGKGSLAIEVTGGGLESRRLDSLSLNQLFEPFSLPPFGNEDGRQMALALELATSRKIAEYAGGTVDFFQINPHRYGIRASVPVGMNTASPVEL